jgi:hypothetical protein
MSQELTEVQNTELGVLAAFIEGVLLQPTLYWKNARAMQLPFTLNPKIIYRGTAASIFNEMQMMGLQFGITGFFQKLFVGDSGRKMSSGQTVCAAVLGGVISANAASPVELIMVQQQRHGGSFFGTPMRIARAHGWGMDGIFRGLLPTMVRDSIYVVGMLALTPLVQDVLMEKHGQSQSSASLVASVVGGVFGAVVSQPFDVLKTCMQGDVEQATYGGLMPAARKVWSEGGIKRIFNGCFWRTANIVGTVYIANECKNRLPPYMFGGKKLF